MIIFDLACICGFQYEGWFNDRDDFEKQLESGILTCPQCGDVSIRKILSPVAVHTGKDLRISHPKIEEDESSQEAAAKKVLILLQKYVEKNYEDVGAQLAEKALKMHYGVETMRNIRGVATAEEEECLEKEGIEVLKIPLPREKDDKLN
ncbi:MAG: DUF1178 family protein [Proteobacteria bacterium]|nr:DUF1178 family protein [Pseudomonadota bacterium]MBU1709270.1 DUF1178 family protein [Pseudomonadota bacterium]